MITELTPKPLSPVLTADPAPPHVLLVIDQFPKSLGGGERMALKLASLLPQYGFTVSILTFFVHPESPVLESPPCPIFLLPLQRTYDLTAFRSAVELSRFLKQHRVQIVQTYFESSDIWAGFVTKAMSKSKLIWSRRDMGILRGSKHQIAYRLMAGMPDLVFAVSEEVRQHCIKVDRIPSDRVRTIYNGLDIVANGPTSNRTSTSGRALVATVGNIRPVKGHDVLVRAAALVVARFPDATFAIAGEVLELEYFHELQDLIRDLNLGNFFSFAGGVKDTRRYLSYANVFVLPSRSEGFSNAIVEAMAASLPVVATDVGGNAEAVKNGVTGFIVPSEDPVALAEAIMRLLSNPSEAEAMGAAGKSLAAEKFTTEAMMGQVTSGYRELLA